MITRIIDWSIANRALVILLTFALLFFGAWSARDIDVDAIPDLSDVQVVVRTEFPGQAPQIVEDQVTYPLTTKMLSVPHAEVVRGYSMFGSSFVYVIFEDGTDLYWARSRVLELLNSVADDLPAGVSPQLGPDATGVGWVYQYMLVTGAYCPDHPQGTWLDPQTSEWYAERGDAPPEARRRLVHHRVFENAAPGAVCPLDGAPLALSEIDLAGLRSLQDWYLRYELTAVDGVSEVAAVGGFLKQYQVVVDPVRLLAYDVPLERIRQAIQRSNLDVGGRVIEMSETEYMVRGLGYLGTLAPGSAPAGDALALREARTEQAVQDLESIALAATADGSPVYLRDVAEVRVGPEIRRGIAEWNGEGEAVGGIVIMRFGENARRTIQAVRARLADLENGLPPGVALRTGYDRSDLIDRAVATLRHTLIEELAIVSLVVAIFLIHARSALVAIVVLPLGVLASLTVMRLLGIDANIMSLGGIAISIGVMVDSSIIMVENAHKHMERNAERVALGEPSLPRARIISESAREVGPSLFFALLIITVSFLPVFALGEESGRLFKPLAFTKTFAMLAGALLAITIVPVLTLLFIAGESHERRRNSPRRLATVAAVMAAPALVLAVSPLGAAETYRWWIVGAWVVLSGAMLIPQPIRSEESNILSRALHRLYEPFFALVMRFKWTTILLAIALMGATWFPLSRLGSEFMPPLEEGDLLYMPTTDPGLSPAKAREILQQTNRLIMAFPEVRTTWGKIGRADTATDPAPLTMVETTIQLQRDKSRWRTVGVPRFYDGWPEWARRPLRAILPDARPITTDELVYGFNRPNGERVPGLNDALQIPGLTNSWTMPIRTRIDMLSTGIKTPVGVKIMGDDLATLSRLADQVAQTLKTSEGLSGYTTSAFAEKTVGGNYLDITINRDEIARYGLHVADVQEVIMSALGGMNVASTVEGLERYPVNIRYPHELRDNLDALRQTLVGTPSGAQAPLGQLASIDIRRGPPMIRSENARLTSWVYVDIAGIDVGAYVARAQRAVAEKVQLPPGFTIKWSGQYEYMQAARARLMVIIPVALALIVVLLYMATRSWLRVMIVLLAVPFSLIGAIWLLYLLDYNLSLAVVIGLIALAGLDAETGLVMLLYLDSSYERFKAEGRMRNANDLWWAVHDGAVRRIRPKTMTVASTFVGLLPLLWASGAGADTMRRLAVPMIGGLTTSFLLELLIYPVVYFLARRAAHFGLFRRGESSRVALAGA